MGKKYIDAEKFYELLLETAITDSDRQFADKVKYAMDKMQAADVIELGRDYWGRYFDIHTRSWVIHGSNEFVDTSFRIERKKEEE